MSLNSKGRLRAGLSMNRFSPMSQTWSPLHWVAGTAFSVDRLDEELLSFRPPAPSVSLCLCVVLKASVSTSISSIRPVSGLHLSCTFGSY